MSTTHAACYSVEHETRYSYQVPVSQSWQLGRLTPRVLPWQRVVSHSLHIDPQPSERHEATDSFGNVVSHFGLHGAHHQLRVRMHCQIEVAERPVLDSDHAMTVGEVREAVRRQLPGADDLEAARMSEATALVPWSEAARGYAESSLQADRPWAEALLELTHRIHEDFQFDATATTVSTSVDAVLQLRRGVSQDFAHLMLACLRAHGLAGRDMSGYLLTDPPPGMPRLMGVDASHAWVAAFLPGHGWVEFDPTNDISPCDRHITIAYGRDYGDVSPVRGVVLGGGGHRVEVSVDVEPA